MKIIKKAELENLRKQYPAGTRIKLIHMDDIQAPPEGTMGTVRGVDDIRNILDRWDNGSSLNVIYGEDVVEIIAPVRLNISKDCAVVFRENAMGEKELVGRVVVISAKEEDKAALLSMAEHMERFGYSCDVLVHSADDGTELKGWIYVENAEEKEEVLELYEEWAKKFRA